VSLADPAQFSADVDGPQRSEPAGARLQPQKPAELRATRPPHHRRSAAASASEHVVGTERSARLQVEVRLLRRVGGRRMLGGRGQCASQHRDDAVAIGRQVEFGVASLLGLGPGRHFARPAAGRNGTWVMLDAGDDGAGAQVVVGPEKFDDDWSQEAIRLCVFVGALLATTATATSS
jgi:hypothetical protein